MAEPLDESDLRILQSFWTERWDLEACTIWEDKYEAIAERHRALARVWRDFVSQRDVLTAVLEGEIARARRGISTLGE
jgi:hypothetical protein